MLVTVATEDGKSSQIEVTAETKIATIKSIAAAELGTAKEIVVTFNGRSLENDVTLVGAGVGNEDLLLVYNKASGADMGPGAGTRTAAPRALTLSDLRSLEPNGVLKFFKENPQLLRQLHHVDAKLAEAVETGNVGKVRTCIMMQQMDNHKAKWTEQREREVLFANPDSEENQAKIARIIEQEAIDQNYTMAMEEAPEVFARVSMLYIDTEINGVMVKAFVDSGAQSTIMSAGCAERCGLMRLVDRRFHGEARGVGTGKILGRIHMAQIKIGNHYFPCSFTILEKSDVDFLFGLDMLKRHLCVIDLKSGVLGLGSAGTTVPFLSEKDLPQSARETQADDLERKASVQARGVGGSSSDSMTDATTEGVPVATPSQVAPQAAPAAPALSTTPPSPRAAGTAAAAPSSHGTEDRANIMLREMKVLQLVGMGFSRQQAEGVLASTGDNVEQAAALLLAQMEM